MNKKAKQILQKVNIDKLPSLPHVLLQLLDACHDENFTHLELKDIIEQDPGLFARIYSAANYDYPAHQRLLTEDSLEQIIHRLGQNTIKSIAVTATVQQFFSPANQEHTDFLKQHWRSPKSLPTAASKAGGSTTSSAVHSEPRSAAPSGSHSTFRRPSRWRST